MFNYLLFFVITLSSVINAQEGKREEVARYKNISFYILNNKDSSQERISLKKTFLHNFDALKRDITHKLEAKLPSLAATYLGNHYVSVVFDSTIKSSALFYPKYEAQSYHHYNKSFEDTHLIIIEPRLIGHKDLFSTLGHEIFHLLHLLITPNEEDWVREGLAQIFEFIITGKLNGANFHAERNNPWTPLITSYDWRKPDRALYGHHMLYFYYLYRQCGGEDFFWKIAQAGEQTNDRGEQLIDNLLRSLKNEKKNCTSFHQSVIHFQIARVHNQVTFINGYDQRYLLYPSMSDFPASDPSTPDFNNWLDSLPPYGPILIKDKKYFKSSLCPNCKKIYLEQKFPFRVLNYHIKDSDDFTLLLIKMP